MTSMIDRPTYNLRKRARTMSRVQYNRDARHQNCEERDNEITSESPVVETTYADLVRPTRLGEVPHPLHAVVVTLLEHLQEAHD